MAVLRALCQSSGSLRAALSRSWYSSGVRQVRLISRLGLAFGLDNPLHDVLPHLARLYVYLFEVAVEAVPEGAEVGLGLIALFEGTDVLVDILHLYFFQWYFHFPQEVRDNIR